MFCFSEINFSISFLGVLCGKENYSIKKFQCGLCPYNTDNSAHFKSHSLLHTQERRYACRFCPKRFNHKSNLTAHLRIHTGEKPFVCTICNQSFTFKASLIVHASKCLENDF